MGEAAEGRCFIVFCGIYWPGDKIADFSPSYSWVDFGEPFRRPTQKNNSQALSWGVQNQLGPSKNTVKQQQQTKISLSLGLHSTRLPWGSGGLPRLGEYEHWVCYGAGGWADADIHLGDMLGSFRDRFGIILE